jgi:hypothetical protein
MRPGCGILIGLLAAMIMQMGCGGGRASSSGGGGTGGSRGNSSGGTSLPKFNHAFIVVEENHSYSAVIGSPAPGGAATAPGMTEFFK